MEPITLITTAIALATPYLLKTGESIAESIGEDVGFPFLVQFKNIHNLSTLIMF